MNELTIALSLKDLEELVDKYAPNEKIILIGHSHGGFVLAQYLNTHPDRVKGAVFIEGGAFSSEINKKLPAVNSVNYFGMDINQILWVKQLIGMDNHAKADYLYDVGRANRNNKDRGQNCPSQNYRAGAASALAIAIGEVNDGNYDFTTNLANFQTKVLFISSDQSKDLGYDFQEKYQASLFPNYVHEKMIGTGHTGIITCRTAETLGYIKEYLEGL
jgi:proline iminopeptidase